MGRELSGRVERSTSKGEIAGQAAQLCSNHKPSSGLWSGPGLGTSLPNPRTLGLARPVSEPINEIRAVSSVAWR